MTLTIKTERLLLRPLDAGDVETVHEYAGDAENTRYMMYLPNGNIEDTRTFLERVTAEWEKDCPGFYEVAVVLEGRQIGAVSVALGEDEAELGWILNRKYWNRGYITEAAMAGSLAVEAALEGETGKMVAFIRQPGKEYKINYELRDVNEICNKEKPFPKEWIVDGNNISQDYIDYALPLIQGRSPLPYENGLPKFLYMK